MKQYQTKYITFSGTEYITAKTIQEINGESVETPVDGNGFTMNPAGAKQAIVTVNPFSPDPDMGELRSAKLRLFHAAFPDKHHILYKGDWFNPSDGFSDYVNPLGLLEVELPYAQCPFTPVWLTLECVADSDAVSQNCTFYKMELILEYDLPVNYTATVAALSTPLGTSAELFPGDGKIIAAFDDTTPLSAPLGVEVKHVFNPEECHSNKAYGKGIRLNVDERLVACTKFVPNTEEEKGLSRFDYIYTDAKGRNHGFEEYFYYTLNGEKNYVNATSVTVNTEGELTYGSHKVTRELRSATGWEATTRLKDVKNLALLEERADEERELEKQAKNYKNALEGYVIVNTETGAVTETVSSPSWAKYGAAQTDENDPDELKIGAKSLGETELLLPESDARNFRSLLAQSAGLAAQIQGCINQDEVYDDQESDLSHQISSLELQIAANLLQKDSCDTQKTLNIAEKTNCQKQISFLNTQKSYNNKLTDFYNEDVANQHANPEAVRLSSVPKYSDGEYNGDRWLNDLNLAMNNEQNLNLNDQITLLNARKTALDDQNQILTDQRALLFGANSQDFVMGSHRNALNAQKNKIPGYKEQNAAMRASLEAQKALCDEQLTKIVGDKKTYLNTFRELLITYEQILSKRNELNASLPVSYMMKDGIVKGFNASGDLCVIFDSYENYVLFERTDNGLLERISDKENNAITFTYDGGKLAHLTDAKGNHATYAYDDEERLVKIAFTDGRELTFAYTEDDLLSQITSISERVDTSASDFTKACFTYKNGRLSSAARYSLVDSIPFQVENANKSILLSSVTLAYRDAKTTLTDERGNVVSYLFDTNGDIEYVYTEENGVVTHAEKHTRVFDQDEKENSIKTLPREESVSYAAKSTLHTLPLEDYVFDNEETSHRVTRNAFWQTETETEIQKTKHEGETYLHESVSTYVYDDEHRLVRKNTLHTQKKESDNTLISSQTVVEKYFYNANGKLIRTEGYTEGKESALGTHVSETVYDKDGNLIRSYSYNTLSPTDKIYSESERDESGRTVADIDATGRHKTSYSYFADGSLAAEHYPSGGTLAYAYDKEGNTVSVTASTADGEGNTNVTHYTAGLVTRVESGNHVVDYEYDGKRRLTAVKLDGADYITYIHGVDDENYGITDATQVVFACCTERIFLNKDDHERLTKYFIEGVTMTDITYENDGRIKQMYDNYGLRSREYTYNADGLLTFYSDYRSMNVGMTYDDRGRPETKTEISRALDDQYYPTEKTVAYTYSYDEDRNRLASVTASGITVAPLYDPLGRSAGKKISVGTSVKASEEISYLKHGDHTTSLPAVMKFKTAQGEERIKYSYDAMGNIIKISEDGIVTTRYEYDALSRLTREDNRAFGKTCLWEYDENGNILSRREYAFTVKSTEELTEIEPQSVVEYKYNGDRLISYGGNTGFSYNALGNPTRYLGKSMTWSYGRHLNSYDGMQMFYDGSNIPTKIADVAISPDNNGNIIANEDLHFLYDHEGALFGFVTRDTDEKYLYRRDALGNIIAILDTSGNVVVNYKYNAWGMCKVLNPDGTENTNASFIGNRNPFRYRGYYYSEELGLYYLKTRFYDPEVGRFISADTVDYLAPSTINGLNLYAYCGNNPVMNVDPSGHAFSLVALIGLGIMALGLLNVVGAQANVGNEKIVDQSWLGVLKIEKGDGYNKTFNTGKVLNAYFSMGANKWDFSVGIDLNVEGWGVNVGIGPTASVGLHLGKRSVEFGADAHGFIYLKAATLLKDGYVYQKTSLHAGTILLALYLVLSGRGTSLEPVYAK